MQIKLLKGGKNISLITFIKKYKWWFLFGTIPFIIIFHIVIEEDKLWINDSLLFYTILIICALFGELFTKSTKFGFILNPCYFTIYQSSIWYIYMVNNLLKVDWFEPGPFPKWAIILWVLFYPEISFLPSNIVGSLFANFIKRFFNEIGKKLKKI